MAWQLKVLAMTLALGASATGCSRDRQQSVAPEPVTRTVIAEPVEYRDVYVDDAYAYEQPPSDTPDAVGYETLSTGDQVRVVQYVHSYPEPVDTFPRVYWSGRWYYNVHGDFVFYDPLFDGWVYYWGPPAPLVSYWNFYYPWAPYSYAVGVYGPGWYWGGVGLYGFHAYGLSVVTPYHHHHHHYHDYYGRFAKRYPKEAQYVAKGVNKGGPIHEGESASPPPKGANGGPTQPENFPKAPGKGDGDPPARAGADGPATRLANKTEEATPNVPTREGTPNVPSRATPTAGKARLISRDPTGVETGRIAARSPGSAPVPGSRVEMTTSNGQRITTTAPLGTTRSAGPSVPTRAGSTGGAPSRSQSLGTAPTGRQPSWGPTAAEVPAGDPFRPATRGDSGYSPAPSRDSGYGYTAPSRGQGPTRSAPSYNPPSRQPSYQTPSYSPPTRAQQPSAPSRSYSPPTRAQQPSAPSRSYSPPTRSSSPSRSYSPPTRSSSPSRSYSPAPSRSTAPSRSYSPPRSSGPSRAPSPSRSAGPSRGSSGPRGRGR